MCSKSEGIQERGTGGRILASTDELEPKVLLSTLTGTEEGETWETSEQKVKEAIKNKLQLEIDVNIERAHRVGRRSSNPGRSDKPRTIVCRLRDWKQKEPILKASRTVKARGIFVNEDFAYETIQRRKEQLPQLRAAKQAGKIAYFVVDKLVIKDRKRSDS